MKKLLLSIVIGAVVLVAIMPFAISTLIIVAPFEKAPEPKPQYTDEEVFNSIAYYWVDHEDELIEAFAPLIEFTTNPAQAVEILEKELHIDVSHLDVDYVLQRAKELKEAKESSK